MPRPPLSVTILSLNEEANIARAIGSVRWAEDILVVDSGSTDRTPEIARSLGARVVSRPWPGYGQQKNFAQQEARHDWVLNIDADEEVPPALASEIQQALERAATDPGFRDVRGFTFPRKTFYLGRWIRHGGWYPNYLARLSDRRHSHWTEPAVHERLEVRGRVEKLENALHHHSFPTIRSQVLTNLKFSQLGTDDLKRSGASASLPRLLLKPAGKFLETYLIKRGFLDGVHGLIISVNAAYSMFLKYAYLMEGKITRESSDENPDRRQQH